MRGVTGALYNIIASDEFIKNSISTYDGADTPVPAIFRWSAPNDAKMPYIIVRPDPSIPDDESIVDRMSYVVDIYDRDEDDERAEEIATRIEKLFSKARPAFQGYGSLGVFRDYRGTVEEDNREVQHKHLEFTVKIGRKDLYE